MKKLILVAVWSVLLAAMACAALATPRTAGTMNSRHTICATVVTASTTSTANPTIPAGTSIRTDSVIWAPTASASTNFTDRDVGAAASAITDLDLIVMASRGTHPPTASAIATSNSASLPTPIAGKMASDTNRPHQFVGTETYGPKAEIVAHRATSGSERIAKLEESTVAHKLLLAG